MRTICMSGRGRTYGDFVKQRAEQSRPVGVCPGRDFRAVGSGSSVRREGRRLSPYSTCTSETPVPARYSDPVRGLGVCWRRRFSKGSGACTGVRSTPSLLSEWTSGKTLWGEGVDQMREGVVIRDCTEGSDMEIGRRVLKSVSEGYLLRQGGNGVQLSAVSLKAVRADVIHGCG